ncbi:thioredoxin domain-containing protein 16 [Microcaecilia unicolor]|uniref:Thioredoxin domain-containing protein 16 n=1 Tax=Microcaecilia unicolor TaxID=1415580 RepID=A0A6P7Z753_9AMPH|nr:thioredoxin domain-containing protein 16 [Microcaecilia unicolor]
MFESNKMNGWISHFIFLLLCIFNMSMTNSNVLQELSHQEYVSSVHPRKTSLIYFTKDALPSVFFLEQLEKSVEPLKDYGISVAKVNCLKEDVSKYCENKNAMTKAYLFRGNVMVREFPTDALFDVNAIVANVLFALLFNEVKYIATMVELQIVEDSVKGRSNLVFVYVQAVGIPEHRAVMEAAFVYGAQYKFVLTTEVAMLENLGFEESSKFSARLFFCHCNMVTDTSQQCRRTLMEQPLTTLNIHRYFKLMEAPLVAEVTGNPEEISSVHLQLGLPLVFVLSQKETYELDKRTVDHVAWQLLGRAGLALLLRDFSKVDVPPNANVAFKQPSKGAPVKYLALQDAGEIIALVEHGIEKEEIQDTLEEEEGEKDRNDQDVQDDQVAEAVHRNKKTELVLELVPSLTEKTFHTVIAGTDHAVVLFYASWEPMSLAVLQSFVEVAMKLKETADVLLSRVDCAEWPDACKKQSVTYFPAIKMYSYGENPSLYTGMLGTKDLLRFIMLSRLPCPLKLTTVEDVEGYLSGQFHQALSHCNISVLGIFSSDMNEAREAFVEVGSILKGYSALGIYFEENVQHLSHRYAVTLPALLLARHNEHRIDGISLSNYNAEDILKLITQKSLASFSEITVENLPAYLRLQKPLLILFSDGNIRHSDQTVILKLVRDKHLETYATCWLNLKNTPVGRGILKSYFGSVPLLPQLVLVDLHSKGQAFAFPSDQTVTEANVLHWLKKIQLGTWNPSTVIADRDWKPPLPDYNFLGTMDAAVPQFAAQRIPVHFRSDVATDEKQI